MLKALANLQAIEAMRNLNGGLPEDLAKRLDELAELTLALRNDTIAAVSYVQTNPARLAAAAQLTQATCKQIAAKSMSHLSAKALIEFNTRVLERRGRQGY